MRRSGKLIPLAIALGLLITAVTATAVSGAIAGTVTMDKAFVTSPGGTLAVTLEDTDLAGGGVHSVKISSTQDGSGFDLTLRETGTSTGVFEVTFGTGEFTGTTAWDALGITSTRTALQGPIPEASVGVDLNGGGDTLDTVLVDSANTVSEATARLDADGDGVTTAGDAGVDLNNDGDAIDTTVTGIDVAGIPTSPTRPVINAATGGIITSSYSDANPSGTRTGAATVETTGPTITVVEPLHNTATRTQATRLIVEVTDADSEVDEGTIRFIIVPSGAVSTTVPLTAEITGGFRAETNLTGVPTGETDIVWRAVAFDKAGNLGQSDSDTDTEAFDDHALRVDTVPPSFDATIAAETGHFWDADAGAIETDPTAADRTSLRVIFNEELDGTTVAATDFTVDDVAPIAAQWFDGAAASVFLTVPEMAANAKPKVALVGGVSDKAGNSVSSLGPVTAVDGIAPALTVTPSPALSQATVNIDVASDEPLLTAPNITVNGSKTGLSVVRVIGTNVFRADYEPSDTPNVYNVQVTVTDTFGNQQTAGEAATDDDDAITFEIDNALAPPIVVPASDSALGTDSPTVTIDWTSEGAEYGIVSAGTSATVKAPLPSGSVNLDTHPAVTLTAATLDGADVLAQVTTTDSRTFTLPTSGLAAGSHEFVFNGKDEAGNDLDANFQVIFTVIQAAPVVEVGPDRMADEGSAVTLIQTTFTDGNSADTHTATVDWGDGSPIVTAVVGEFDRQVLVGEPFPYISWKGTVSGLPHLYVDDGDYTVTVTVADDGGAKGTGTMVFTVNNISPVVDAGDDQAVNKGAAVVLAPASFTDVGALDTHTAIIDWGDGSPVEVGVVAEANGSGTVAGSHVYTDDGLFEVTVTVFDFDGGEGGDSLTATDRPTCNGLAATHVGTDASETIIGTPFDDVIVGLGGNDIIRGRGGDDTICGGPGGDMIAAGPGNDWVFGGLGYDLITGGPGFDTLRGGPGNDTILGGTQDDVIYGGNGNDQLAGSYGDDWILGGDGNDRLIGNEGDDVLFGHLGDDSFDCGPGPDVARGGPGTDGVVDATCEIQVSIP